MSEKKKMGRPPKQIDKTEFEKLCLLQCTEEEIAGWFDCSVDTIERWVKREYSATFAEIYAKYKGEYRSGERNTNSCRLPRRSRYGLGNNISDNASLRRAFRSTAWTARA